MKKYILFSLIVFLLIMIAGFVRAFAIEISADVIKTGGSDQEHISKTYMKGNKQRMEMPGQHQYTIFRQDKNIIWVVMPDSRTFLEMPYDPQLKLREDGKFKGEISRELISSENIDGHPAKKYLVTVNEGTKTVKYYEWIATGINFAIKKAGIDGSWSEEYRNIQYSVPDSLFEVPAGYQKISVPAIR